MSSDNTRKQQDVPFLPAGPGMADTFAPLQGNAMTCPSCTDAMRNPRADMFTSGCMSCEARALAVTRADLVEDYRGAVERMFGDRAKDGHKLVKEWLQRVKQRRIA